MAVNDERRGPAPFNMQTADIILQSPDGTNFYVAKADLGKASPVFAQLCAAPHPPMELAQNGDYVGDKPVMKVTEGKAALERLLLVCYPGCKLPDMTLSCAIDLLVGGDKYELESAKVRGKEALWELLALDSSTYSVFAVAHRFGFVEIMASVAVQSLTTSTFDEQMAKIKSASDRAALKLADSSVLYHLWNLHSQCSEEVRNLTYVVFWIFNRAARDFLPLWSLKPTGCYSEETLYYAIPEYDELGGLTEDWTYNPVSHNASDFTRFYVKTWFLDYLSDVRRGLAEGPLLQHLSPADATVRASMAAGACAKCRATFHAGFSQLTKLFVAKAEECIRRVASQAAQNIRSGRLP